MHEYCTYIISPHSLHTPTPLMPPTKTLVPGMQSLLYKQHRLFLLPTVVYYHLKVRICCQDIIHFGSGLGGTQLELFFGDS